MKSKKKFELFNDGIVFIYNAKKNKSSFNASINPKSKEDLDFVVKLCFQELSKREEDVQFAENRNRELNLKIKCRGYQGLNINQKAVVDNVLYSIINIDYNRDKSVVYLYLEEERKLNG